MDKTEKVVSNYKKLQNEICGRIEELDGRSKFVTDNWQSKLGTGITKIINDGKKIEKGAVNFSYVKGNYSKKMDEILGESGDEFVATGLSSIFHPVNPWCPIIHFNVRYFTLNNGINWFGGGIDLTPHYVDKSLAGDFHRQLKGICDNYSEKFYPDFKKWCDDYFYLPHRNETRGVSGIFFDRIKPDENISFEDMFQFTLDLAENYADIYSHQIAGSHGKTYSEAEKDWQNLRRSRYVEYNLLFDRGTKFGIESGGRAESILVSMPPAAKWKYNYNPGKGTKEFETQQLLKKGIDWLSC